MSDGAPNDSILVFAGFLEHLSRQGFTIGVDNFLRLQELLNKISGDCAPSDLKTLLCPVFATDKTQQDQFYKAFDSYFNLFQSAEPQKAASRTEWYPTVLGGYEPLAVRKWPYVLAGAAAVILILVSGLFILPKQPEEPERETLPEFGAVQQPDKPPETTDQRRESLPQDQGEKTPDGTAAQAAGEPTETSPPPSPEPLLGLYQRQRSAFHITAIGVLLVVLLFYAWYRFNRRKLVLQKQRGKKPPYVWPLRAETRLRPFESEQFYTAARLMRRRQVDEYYRLDVDASIASTIDALGYPSFRYKAASKMPDYLVLIERASFRDHQAQLFNELAKALEREAIFLVRYFYDGDPRVCRSGARDSIHLVELQRKHPQHRLLIFGNGDRLIDPITGKLESWASVFSAWRERAVLTPEIPSRWGAREVALAGQFIIAPATLDGLASVIDQFEATVMTDLRVWRRNAFEAPPDEREQYGSVHFLHSYLGEEAFQWLCACAVYPELHWDLTVHLGSLECMKEGLVRAENLQRLVHLPWFRSGTIPDELRWLLIRQLDKHREKAVRLALVALLEKNPPPKGTFAYDDYQLDLVVQQWLSRRDRKTAREVLRKMAELPSSQVTRDYTVLRFLDSSRISPLDMVLPRQFRKRLYHNWELLYLPIAAAVLEFSKKQLVKARVFVASVHRYVDSVTLPLLATEHRKRVAAFATAAVLLVTGWGGFYLFKSSLNRAPVNSVAILPFANQTGDQRMDAIGDEIAEGIINHLYQVKNLRVISYGDVEQYKGPELDLQAIGKELGVNAVMIGRISMRDGAFTVTAELVDAGDKSRIWSQQEKLRFADLMSAHSRLARSVLDKLGVRLSEEESKELDAEQLYETGRNSLSQRTPEGFNKAIEYFDKAVALKPDYALAHAGLADCYNMLATYGALAPSEAFPKAKSEAQKALEIDDTLAEAHVSLAYALFRGDWKWAESEREFRQALVLNSKLAQAHQWYANLLVALGRSDEAIAQTWRAQELDSTSSIIRSNVALVYIYAHRYDDSIAACQKFLELDPTYFAARRYLGQAYAQKGKYDLAISELQRAVATNGSPLIRAELAYTYARAAKKDEAQKILTDLQRLSSERYISPYHIALIYSGLGNKEETFNWLEQAFQGRTDYLVFLKVDPRFDWLHGDQRFASLLERIGLL